MQFRKKKNTKGKYKVIPGWNRNVKEIHKVARDHFLKWIDLGRERNTLEYDEMRESRRVFKEALNECKMNEFREKSITIQEKFENKDMNAFWKDVKQKKTNNKKSRIIDGQTDTQDILRVFSNKFFSSFVQEASNFSDQQLLDDIRDKWADQRKMYLKISPHTIKKLSDKLNNGAGHDNFHPVLLKSGSFDFLTCISKFINMCYIHCIFPPNLLRGDLNPTVKDLKGNITDSANYRPVMQSSCLLKLVELHILSVLEEKVFFNSRQFGFVKGSSTSDACFLLKETVHSYMKNNGRAFSVFVDLSKAFDMVDYCILGKN